MTDDAELMERAAEAAHDAWWAAKKAAGFHAPEKCPCEHGHDYDHGTCTAGCPHPEQGKTCARCGFSILLDNGVYGICDKCHSDMIPYADLDEPTKELDRAHVRAVHGVYAAELERLRAENEALRKLAEYAQHNAVDCARGDRHSGTVGWVNEGGRSVVRCTCGYDAAKRGAGGTGGGER